MFSILIPAILQAGFASITLDDGHVIQSTFVLKGTVSNESGFVVKVGDMADIQSSLNGNSCLIRVSEIKARFEQEVEQRVHRCDQRLDEFRKSLDDSKQLNQHLKLKLEDEKAYSKRLFFTSSVIVGALTASTLYFSLR